MTIDSLSAAQRSIANRRLIRILSIGFCASSILHIIAIFGINYLSNINTEAEIEITTIERVELEAEVSPSISQSGDYANKSNNQISKSIASTFSASSAITAFNTSKKSNFTQFTSTTPNQPQSKPPQSIIATNSNKIPARKSSPTTLAPIQKSYKSNHPRKDRNQVIQQPNLSIPKDSRHKLPPELDNDFGSIDNPPSPYPHNIDNQSNTKPRNNHSKNNKLPLNRSNQNTTIIRSNDSGGNYTNQTDRNTNRGDNNGGNSSTIQNNGNSPLLGNNSGNSNHNENSPNSSNSEARLNSNDGGDSNHSNGGNGSNSNNSNKPNGNSSSGNNNNAKSITQCLRNCTIKYPDKFQDSDVGKGKISVRVTIDGNGIVTTAEIARSSENQQLDSFALAAVKKMQFNATGETRIRRIKVNTITNN